jgi:GGDEF domain-containing protein
MSEALAPVPSTGGEELSGGGVTGDGQNAGPGRPGADRLISLLHRVAVEGTGLDMIYEALSLVAERFALEDVVVAIRHETAGLQAFRLQRRVIGRSELDRIEGGTTFLSVPDTVPPAAQKLVTGIAEVAFSTHLAQRHVVRDPLTGLLSRGVFNEALRAAAAQSSRYGWVYTVMVLRTDDGGTTPSELEVRRLGHAFARALRTGDTGGRLYGATFAALLPNATSDSLRPLVRRFAEESGSEIDAVRIGSATAPKDSVDPAELFRMASSRVNDR